MADRLSAKEAQAVVLTSMAGSFPALNRILDMYRLVEFRNKTEVSADNLVFTGPDSPWEVMMDLEKVQTRINNDYFKKAPPFVSKYLPLLPVRDYSGFVSLKEGSTPLIKSRVIGKRLGLELFFKAESKNPTGSFKDRGSAVEISVAKELGAKGIAVASTGNMAASCSCYAASAHIPCFVFVPEDVPQSKLAQVISFGGRIVQVKGSYNDAARLAREAAEELGFYLAGDYAFRLEGQKTAAFELVDQLDFNAPDAVIVPMGCGTNLSAYSKGFSEYRELGFTNRIPRLIGVQAEGAAPIVGSFVRNEQRVTPLKSVHTIASAIAVADPLDGEKALRAIYSSGGEAVAASDTDILKAQYLLSKEEGLFAESSGAAALHAVMHLVEKGRLEQGQKVVCVLSGDGLKDPGSVLKVAIKPPTIKADVKSFVSLYESSFFEGETVCFTDREKIVFSTPPSPEQAAEFTRKYFNADYSAEYLSSICDAVSRFLKKGKSVTFSDLQDIIQDTLESVDHKAPGVLVVKDFDVRTGKDVRPEAKVAVEIDKEPFVGKASGVGPVDAVVNALQQACNDKMQFSLNGYKVDIRSSGADAVVYVEMKLTQNGLVSLGRGASPDIIQASIEAFEEAYNGFYNFAGFKNGISKTPHGLAGKPMECAKEKGAL